MNIIYTVFQLSNIILESLDLNLNLISLGLIKLSSEQDIHCLHVELTSI